MAATDILTSIQVRPYNLQFVKTMRTLSPSDVGNLINLRGMVVRVSSIIPDLQEAFFRCTLCGHSLRIPVVKGVVEVMRGCLHHLPVCPVNAAASGDVGHRIQQCAKNARPGTA